MVGDCFEGLSLDAELVAAGAEGLIRVSFGDLRAGSTLAPSSTGPVALTVAVHECADAERSPARADARPRVIWDEGPAWTVGVPREDSSITVSKRSESGLPFARRG